MSKLVVKAPKYTIDKATGEPRSFSSTSVTQNGKSMKLKLQGILFWKPNKQESEEYQTTNYKFGVQFNEDDLEILDSILGKMEELVDDEYTGKPPHDEGKIYFKLRPNSDSSKFTTKMDVAITPKKLIHEDIDFGNDVTVEFLVGGWYMDKDDEKKFGLTLTVKQVWFKEELKKPVPKRKKPAVTSDDEVRIFHEVMFSASFCLYRTNSYKRSILLIVP